MSKYLTGAAKVLDELEKNRRSEVYGNIGRETFEKICKEEKSLNEEEPCNFCGTPSSEYPQRKCARTPICTNYESDVKPLYIDPCELTQPPQEYTETKWISKEEALKIWQESIDQAQECTNDKCRCKSRKKENEGLKRKEIENDDTR